MLLESGVLVIWDIPLLLLGALKPLQRVSWICRIFDIAIEIGVAVAGWRDIRTVEDAVRGLIRNETKLRDPARVETPLKRPISFCRALGGDDSQRAYRFGYH